MPFVPDELLVPRTLVAGGFLLEALGPQHNEEDYAAWTSSIDHIRSTPGFPDGSWPREMTAEENRADLERHAADFAARRGFTYTVRDAGGGPTIGCVYIYPAKDSEDDAQVQSWVTAAEAERDGELREAVRAFLLETFPFERVDYAG